MFPIYRYASTIFSTKFHVNICIQIKDKEIYWRMFSSTEYSSRQDSLGRRKSLIV
jgi:hypothetical protein